MVAGVNLGPLSVTLQAVLDRFNKNMDEAREKIGGVARKMGELVTGAAKIGAAAVAAGAAITAGLVRAGLSAVDAQAKLARSVGGTINGLKALEIAGGDAGVQVDTIRDAAAKLTARLGDVQRQGGPAANILRDLGLNARELSKLDIDARFAAIADSMRRAGLSASQQADALRQLGIEQKEIVGLMIEGGGAIRAAAGEVERFGLSISEVDAAKVEAANDAVARIGRTLANIKDQVAIALAPLIQEIAQRFNDVTAANGGFRDAARRGAEIAVRAIAKVGDVLQGLRVVFKGVELIARGFWATVISVFQLAAEGVTFFVDSILQGVNTAIDALNRIPGVEIAKVDLWTDSPFMQGLRGMAEEARNAVGDTRAELHELAMQEMPSEKAERFLQAVEDRANAAAEATVKARQSLIGLGGAEGFGAVEDDGKAAEAERQRRADEAARLEEARAQRVEMLRQSLATEAQLETEAFYARLQTLDEANALELEQLGGYQAAKEQLEAEHMERLREIREKGMSEIERFHAMSWDRQINTVAGSIANMTAGVASGNKKLFELNKAASLAQAVTSLPAAIIESYKNAGGYPFGIAAAAAMAAAGAAQIAQIKNAKYGSGTAPSQAGTPATPVAPVGRGQTISVEGINPDQLYSGAQMRRLLEGLQGALDDGATLVLNN